MRRRSPPKKAGCRCWSRSSPAPAPFRIGFNVLLPGFLILAGLPGMAAGDQAGPAVSPTVRTVHGRIAVAGPDPVENATVAKWAEEWAVRLERLLDVRLPFRRSAPLRIVLRSAEPGFASANVSYGAGGDPGAFHLAIAGTDSVDMEEAREALCEALLFAHLSVTGRAGGAPAVPRWLAQGLSRNLRPASRAEDVQTGLQLWDEGRRQAVAGVLGGSLKLPPDEGRAVHGLFLRWLLSRPAPWQVMRRVLQRLADGGLVEPEWLAATFPDFRSPETLERLWDEWVAEQRRVVFSPGETTAGATRQMESELLLVSGDSGIPVTSNLTQQVTWPALIERRDLPWIPAFAREKAARLRLAAVGRGEDLMRVADSYGLFLDALARGEETSQALSERLRQAEAGWANLKSRVREGDAW